MSLPKEMEPAFGVTFDPNEAELFERYGPLDVRPGFYYASISRTDGAKILARGPFPTHKDAILSVPKVKDDAYRMDPKAPWYAYGTARCDRDEGPGVLDRQVT